MTIQYMRVAAINAFVRALSTEQFAQLVTREPDAPQATYDYSQHFFRAVDADDPDFLCDLDLDVHFFSEGPCEEDWNDSYCSYDPDIPLARYPTTAEIQTAKRVVEAYLKQGGKSFATSDAAIESEI